MVIQPQAGVPTGTPDIFFCKGPIYGWLEVKSAGDSLFQPLQKERIAQFNEWSFARVVFPGNWPRIKERLELIV